MLAAGEGKRMQPITITKPKPLIKVANKTILEFNLEQLSDIIDELILVIGYKSEMIKSFLRKKKYKFKIKIIEQKERLGTGDALLKAKKFVKDRFIVMMGDDLYSKDDIVRCLGSRYAVLVKKAKVEGSFGICNQKNGRLKKIEEKPKIVKNDLINTGFYVIDKDIFDFLSEIELSNRGEYELTDAVNVFCKEKKIDIVFANYWLPMGYVWDILNANECLLKILKGRVEGIIEDNVVLKNNVVIGKGTIIKSGTYIEGPVIIGNNCRIGPNCYLRGATSIGNNCKIGNSVEIKNCVVGDNTNISHLSYFGDSIIGDFVNIGAGTITANLRHDGCNVKSIINGSLLDTHRKKFGTVIGDYVKTGINTSIYPGRKIWPKKTTLPGEIVKLDVK